jgi:hypothetical protein
MPKKSRKKPTGAYIDEMEGLSNALMGRCRDATAIASGCNVDDRAAELMSRRDIPQSAQEFSKLFRDLIETTGTHVDANDRDMYGNGDQSKLQTDREGQVFRNIWTEGADISAYLQTNGFSTFAMNCVQGNKAAVERMLKATSSQKERVCLLEKRETSFRCSPLLLTIGLAKHPQTVMSCTGCQPRHMDYEGVAKVLLKYGARPDVKDVAGKTAVHWGAGAINTPVTRNIADFCIQATKSCQYFGKEVTLQGLSNETYNGMTGVLGGYVVDTERRAVHVEIDGATKVLAMQPKNISHNGNPILDETLNLVDVPDRLGGVALHEVVMNCNHGADTATFLCDKHNASVDISEFGITPRRMVMKTIGGMGGEVFDIVKARACRMEVLRQCSQCNKAETHAKTFSRCSRCGDARYCSRDCQLLHWPTHKGQCTSKGVKLSRPKSARAGTHSISFSSKGQFSGGGYAPPTGTAAKEKFWIKVQCIGDTAPHLVYDQTRTCEFDISPGTPGHKELLKKVQDEPGALGKKTHFRAEFDSAGDLTVYPHTARLLEW